MKKRILSALLSAVLCLGLMNAALAADTTYRDVPSDHWATESIARATQLGIFNGVGEGLFGFGQPITRAEFVAAVVRLLRWEPVKPATPSFADVPGGKWFYSAVETAAANGMFPKSFKNFRPYEALERGDMAAMVIRALGYTSLSSVVTTLDCPFMDVTVNKGYITMADDLGLMHGVGSGLFAPNGTASREQAAVVLMRLYDRLYADRTLQSDADGRVTVNVKTPNAAAGDRIPTTPLEPIVQLYEQLRAMKKSGQDMSKAVLVLSAGGVCTVTSRSGEIVESSVLSAEQVQEILKGENVDVYYSDRFESAYCICELDDERTATVWYQNEKSMAAKLQLAGMFGVTAYILK